MAGHPPGDDAGAAGTPGVRAADQRLHRVRSDRGFAAHRAPDPDLRAAPAPAAWGTPGGARGGRDRDDRRPVGALVRTEPARHHHPRAQRRGHQGAAGAVPGLLGGSRPGRHGQQPRLAGVDLADRLPAGRRQALHRALHAGQGLGPDAAGARAVVHGVQLHDAPGVRLPDAVPGARRRDADGRRRPVGEHHRGPRADPADVGRRGGREPGPRHRLQAAALAVRREVRQERGRRLRVARPGAHDAVRLLPVLGERRRPGHRHLHALVHDLGARARSRRSMRPWRLRPRGARPNGGSPST